MMVARFSIEAKFGYKQNVVELMQRWLRDVGSQVGVTPERTRILSGSIGGRESTVQSEHVIENLTELNRIWDKLAALPEHQKWGKELEPFVVSGTNRWEVYRLL